MNNKVTEKMKEQTERTVCRNVCLCVLLPTSVQFESQIENDRSGRRDELDLTHQKAAIISVCFFKAPLFCFPNFVSVAFFIISLPILSFDGNLLFSLCLSNCLKSDREPQEK